MPALQSLAYPNSVIMTMDGLQEKWPQRQVRPGVPPNFQYDVELITVRRIGGGPDEDDVTDYPILQIACFAPSYLLASEMASEVQVEVMSWPLREIGPDKILVDEAEIYVGDQDLPDMFPDERKVVSSYRLGLRRQFRP